MTPSKLVAVSATPSHPKTEGNQEAQTLISSFTMRLTRITLIVLALVMGFGFYRLIVYLLDDVDAQTFQATEEVMVDTAHVLAGMLETDNREGGATKPIAVSHFKDSFTNATRHEIDAHIHQHSKDKLGINAYVCNAQGMVIYDSNNDQRTGQNYSKYNDVLLTLRGEYGARSTREDEHDSNSSVLYVAAPVKSGDKVIGTVTVYKPQADVMPFISQRRSDILTSTLLIGSGIILFTIAVFVWVFRPVGQLTEYAKAVSRGERLPLPNLGKGREVNTLGKALHDMRETLEGRRYVENYVSALTHELKSPLAAIRGAAELLDEDMPAEQRKKFLQNIQQETKRSEILVSNLLVLSELEGMPHLKNQQQFDLVSLCREIAADITPRASNKNLTITTQFPQASEVSILGDSMVLRMAIVNLLENAISFSPADGEVVFSLETDDHHALVQVTDQGPGIPDYALEKAFDHFYSLPRPDSKRKGSGLGLALVREATKLHDGEVSIKNIQPHGCQAEIRLPH